MVVVVVVAEVVIVIVVLVPHKPVVEVSKIEDL